MIQDIGNHKLDVTFDAKAVLSERDFIIAFDDKRVYMKKKNADKQFLSCEDILPIEYRAEALEKYKKHAVYLLKLDEKRIFLLPAKFLKNSPLVEEANISIFREKNERAIKFTMITAWHLYRWYEETKFCGSCGVRLRHGKKERAMVCPICDRVIYPRIFPAIIAGVYDGDRILLTKRSKDSQYYSLVSGYCEIGETIEETVHREVKEETGVSVSTLNYYKSQPWASSQSLLSGFFAKLDGDAHIHIDKEELTDAIWVKREELEGCYSKTGVSLTAEMIEYFQKYPEKFS